MKLEHREYSESALYWRKIRDVVAGEEAVKARRTEYLPMLTSQAESGDIYAAQAYENYLLRAGFYGAASRTVQGLVGAVLRKEMSVEGVPDDHLRTISDEIGFDFESLSLLAQSLLRELVSVGRAMLLVDRDADPEAKPYVVRFPAEDIVFWARSPMRGREVPTTIAIRQTYLEPKKDDVFGTEAEERTQFLVLRFGMRPDYVDGAEGAEAFGMAPTNEPFYWQEIWRYESKEQARARGKTEQALVLFKVVVPTKSGGRYWNEIPGDIVNAVGGITCDLEEPPLLPLCNVVLSHYRGSADLEWGRHMTAIPQPWASGFDVPEGSKLVVGSGAAWVTPTPGANVQYLEFSGAGLGHIAEGLREKEKQMAVLGARMLEEQPAAAEAMGTVRLRQAGERSVLATIAESASAALTRAIQRYLVWLLPAFESVDRMREVSVQLATDFDSSQMDPATLASLTQSLQAGTISWETFAYNVRRGEMLPPGVTDEEERARIQIGAPGRSRKDELMMLQADVREGRISVKTYLEQIQALGMLAGIDVSAELAAVEEDKLRSDERQMAALMGRLGEGEAAIAR